MPETLLGRQVAEILEKTGFVKPPSYLNRLYEMLDEHNLMAAGAVLEGTVAAIVAFNMISLPSENLSMLLKGIGWGARIFVSLVSAGMGGLAGAGTGWVIAKTISTISSRSLPSG